LKVIVLIIEGEDFFFHQDSSSNRPPQLRLLLISHLPSLWIFELSIVPKLAPKIMLNEDGENITLSNNTEMFKRWWDAYKDLTPFKETPVIHNYAATNLIPRHLGPEFVIHGAKLYAPWEPSVTEVTLVISEWFKDRSYNLLKTLDERDHPFS